MSCVLNWHTLNWSGCGCGCSCCWPSTISVSSHSLCSLFCVTITSHCKTSIGNWRISCSPCPVLAIFPLSANIATSCPACYIICDLHILPLFRDNSNFSAVWFFTWRNESSYFSVIRLCITSNVNVATNVVMIFTLYV